VIMLKGMVLGFSAAGDAGTENGETTIASLYRNIKNYQKLGCNICLSGGSCTVRINKLPIAKLMQDVFLP